MNLLFLSCSSYLRINLASTSVCAYVRVQVREVLGAGADVRAKDCNGKTALQLATKEEIVNMLKEAESKLAASA